MLDRICKTSSRSPVFNRRPAHQDQIKSENDNDIHTSQCDSSNQPMTLLSLDTNGVSTVDETHTNNSLSSPMNNNKRSLESSSPEQVLIKRRFQKSIPSNFSFKIIKTLFFFPC